MADIQAYLDAIENAVYGEDVRGSIHDAIEIINDVGEKVITAGTAVTSPSSSVEGFFEDSLYFNTNTDDLWQCTGTGWSLLGNLKGSQGNPGNPGQAATIAVGTVTKGDNASVVNSGTSSAAVFDFVLPKGDKGDPGVNTWGSITGDISSQTDLADALDANNDFSKALVENTVGWANYNLVTDMDTGVIGGGKVTLTKGTGTAVIYNESSLANSGARIKLYGIPKNTDCKLTFTATAGTGGVVKLGTFADYWIEGGLLYSSTIANTITETEGFYEIAFNSGDDPYEYIGIDLYCTDATAAIGTVTYSGIMVRGADVPYKGFTAMHQSVTDVITDVYGVMGENGAKNKWDDTYFSPILQNLNSATYSYSDNVYTINTIAKVGSSRSGCYWQTAKLRAFFERYVGLGAILSFDCKGDGNFGARLGIDGSAIVDVTTNYQRYTYSVDDLANIGGIVFYNDDTASGHVIYVKNIMISDARDTNTTYQPPAMTNRELTEKALISKGTFSSVDLNNFKESGLYNLNGSITNTPNSVNYGVLEVNNYDAQNAVQKLYPTYSGENIYIRTYRSGTWGSWYKFTGTVVS